MKRIIIHTVLFALFPLLSLYLYNSNRLPLRVAIGTTIGLTLLIVGLWFVSGLVVKNRNKSAFIASIFPLLFFSFGHLLNFFGSLVGLTSQELLVVSMVLLALAIVWVVRSSSNTYLPERVSILNAYYFPDQNYAALYPGISPVNTFRVILNQYFDTHYPLLEDRSCFSPIGHSFRFTEVTNQVKPNP